MRAALVGSLALACVLIASLGEEKDAGNSGRLSFEIPDVIQRDTVFGLIHHFVDARIEKNENDVAPPSPIALIYLSREYFPGEAL